jgi:hypothetical protein
MIFLSTTGGLVSGLAAPDVVATDSFDFGVASAFFPSAG